MKRFQKVILCISAAYFLTVVGATIYAQTGYVNSLPKVILAKADEQLIPISGFSQDENGNWQLNIVEQQDGPWGKKYVVKQLKVIQCLKADEETMRVYDAEALKKPYILSTDAEFLYEGMEVRIGGKQS